MGYLSNLTRDCIVCEPGAACSVGSDEPTLCSPGTYNPLMEQHRCFDCPAGSFQGESGATSSISQQVIGFDADGALLNSADATFGTSSAADVVESAPFKAQQDDFYSKYASEFELAVDEGTTNKLAWTTIHKEYVETTEATLLARLGDEKLGAIIGGMEAYLKSDHSKEARVAEIRKTVDWLRRPEYLDDYSSYFRSGTESQPGQSLRHATFDERSLVVVRKGIGQAAVQAANLHQCILRAHLRLNLWR